MMNFRPEARETPLAVAFAASLLVHATLGMFVSRDFNATRGFAQAPQGPLSVRIERAPAPWSAMPVEAPAATPAASRASPPVINALPGTGAAPAERMQGAASGAAAPAQPSATATPVQRYTPGVQVVTDPTLQRVGWFLEQRSRDEFPVEVRRPVRLAAPLQFDYPAAALDVHREGTVLAWLAVSASGEVTELNIVSGDDDFSEAVAEALAHARLEPATNIEDQPIPFYTVLEFNFHIDAVADSAGASPAAIR